jgi:branched-chain amino acid transport system substrate-binding protein
MNGAFDYLTTIKNRKLIFFGLLIVMIAFPAIGCKRVDPVVKIGLVGPFVGKNRDIGYDVIYSTRLAVREINKNGGIDDYRIALVALDDFGDPEMAKKNAEALVADNGVVAVIGHWLPETTKIAAEIYEVNDLPFVSAGLEPFGPIDPLSLPDGFRESYQEVTPFDEEAGPFSGAGYDAAQLLFSAMVLAVDESGAIDRSSVSAALQGLTEQGITGSVYAP